MKSRIAILFALVLLAWSLVMLRAFYLQILPQDRLQSLNDRQFQTTITLHARRGAIVDRNGKELALSQTAYSLYADPKLLVSPKSVSRRLAKELGMSPTTVLAKIKDRERRFVWIARQMPREKYEKIKSWELKGLAFVEEFKRVYPNEFLLGHSLGFVGSEGNGLEGLELAYEEQLTKHKKKLNVPRDARGRPLILDGLAFAENPEGVELKLTVDADIQHALESELLKAQKDFDADQTFGVILDAKTSAVVAMASTPSFDPNSFAKYSAGVRRNRLVADSFEPGSTLKTFALAGAMRDKLAAPNKKYNTENGSYKVGDRIIREAESSHNWANLTVSEILAYSSNIGTTKIAFELGADRLRQTLLDFGLGAKSGIDLPGEARGIIQPGPWNQHLLSNVSFGQGIAVTAIQLANAYAVIANGGVLNRPFLVQSQRDTNTGEVIEAKPHEIRRVLSVEDAANLRLMLAGVTAPQGTGVNAKVDGFVVAGKTGTAQKVDPNGRGYLKDAYLSSFAGFIPATDPKFVILVAVDHPKKTSYYGSQVAAPLFSRVASYAARKEGLAPIALTENNIVRRGPALAVAAKKGDEEKSFAVEHDSIGKFVPNLQQLSLREVLKRTASQGIPVHFVGTGIVRETDPPAGAPLDPGSKLTIYLR